MAMKVGLFVPCYVDQFFPEAAASTLKLLRQQGLEVEVPLVEVCCGQVNANSGYPEQAIPIQRTFARVFKDFDYVVCPSGSCTSMIRNHTDAAKVGVGMVGLQTKTYELCEFLHDVLGMDKLKIDASLSKRVGLHTSCHGHRELRLGRSTENQTARPDKLKDLLAKVSGITVVDALRRDECCGFGGSFCVTEEAVSARMGGDRVADFGARQVDYVTSADVSCLMHLRGVSERDKRSIKFVHIAQILAGDA